MPGNTAESIAFCRSALQRMIAPHAPRSVFCVVVETMSACGIGDGYTPPATRPATWAMSTKNVASTESAI